MILLCAPEVCPVSLPESTDHTQAIVFSCVGGIVVVGLVLVLAYRVSVEIYDRREFSRFEKERQQLNWNKVRGMPLTHLGGLVLGGSPHNSQSLPRTPRTLLKF